MSVREMCAALDETRAKGATRLAMLGLADGFNAEVGEVGQGTLASVMRWALCDQERARELVTVLNDMDVIFLTWDEGHGVINPVFTFRFSWPHRDGEYVMREDW